MPTEHANTRAERRTRNVQRTTHSAERTQADGCNVPHTRQQQQAGDYSKSGSATTCNSLACTTWLLFSQLNVLLLRLTTIDQRVHLRDSVSNPSCTIRTAIALLLQRLAQQHRAHPDATCNECARACQSVRPSVVAGRARRRRRSSSGRQCSRRPQSTLLLLPARLAPHHVLLQLEQPSGDACAFKKRMHAASVLIVT